MVRSKDTHGFLSEDGEGFDTEQPDSEERIPEERILYTENNVTIEWCCEILHNVITNKLDFSTEDGYFKENGDAVPKKILITVTGGYLSINYCPFCGQKINIVYP